MRLVGCLPVLAPSALLMKGWSGSGLIGPWPFPAGGSCQSATLDCQPKSAEARLGVSLGSAGAVAASAAKSPVWSAARTPPVCATCRSADDVCLEMDPDIGASAYQCWSALPFCAVCPSSASSNLTH